MLQELCAVGGKTHNAENGSIVAKAKRKVVTTSLGLAGTEKEVCVCALSWCADRQQAVPCSRSQR